MRVLGLDYGERTVGVAVSDEGRCMAFGLEVIRRRDEISVKKSIARIKEIINEYNADTLVLGYPVHSDGAVSVRCEKTLAFKERLERNFKRAEVVLWDERFSTQGARRALLEAGLNNIKQDAVIDKMAAVFILQGYLDNINMNII